MSEQLKDGTYREPVQNSSWYDEYIAEMKARHERYEKARLMKKNAELPVFKTP